MTENINLLDWTNIIILSVATLCLVYIARSVLESDEDETWEDIVRKRDE